MNRRLSQAENAALDRLASKVEGIVTAADLNRLTGTQLLDGPGAAQDYADFHRRFQQLPASLQQLITAGKLEVNPDLDPSMGANAKVDTDAPDATSIEVTAELVADDRPDERTVRAITLLHELSHTIYEPPDFPVKDFNYRKSWGHGYLPGRVGQRNADTYAEAAALIAEQLENAPCRYRARGRIPAQTQALRGLRPLNLGPALAWADLKVNRAWMRSDDYQAFAQLEAGSFFWPQELARLSQDRFYGGQVAIEADLRQKQIIADRTGLLRVDLDATSKATAKNIRLYMTSLKQALNDLKLSLSEAGAAVTYNAATKVLDVPRTTAGGGSIVLADAIVGAVVEALSYTDPADPNTARLNAHKLGIVNVMFDNDRGYEKGYIDGLVPGFQARQSPVPSQGDWASAAADLDLAEVKGIADRLTAASQAAEFAASPAGAAIRQDLDSLDQAVQPDITTAVQIGNRLANLSAAQTQRRKDNFTSINTALSVIMLRVRQYYPGKVPVYKQLMRWIHQFTN